MSTTSFYPFVSEEAKEKYLSYYDDKSKSWPHLDNAQDRMVNTSYGQTFLRIGGPLNAPSLLLIPGDEESSLAWKYVIESLSKEFRTYALDRIGDVGRSIPNQERPIRTTDMVRWLDEAVTKVMDISDEKGKRVRIVAHSYGAWQTSLYAASHAERIGRMVLMAPTATVLPTRTELLIRAIIYGSIPLRSVAQWHTSWFDPISMKLERSRKYLKGVMEENALAKQCFQFRKPFVMPTKLTENEWLVINSVPTLFLVGDGEVMYSPQKVIERLKRVAPCVECKVVPEADHHMQIVNPDWVSSSLLQFLSENM